MPIRVTNTVFSKGTLYYHQTFFLKKLRRKRKDEEKAYQVAPVSIPVSPVATEGPLDAKTP